MTEYPADYVLERRLSLAVQLVDPFTMTPAPESLEVWLEGRAGRAVRNTSGFVCFNDVEDGPTVLRVRDLRSRPRFLPAQRALTLPMPDPLSPSLRVPLAPAPTYPFPAGATLVRGRVVRPGTGEPVDDASVEVLSHPLLSRTASSGEYVLFFVPPSTGVSATLRIEKDGSSALVTVNVGEGETLNAGTTYLA